jgi:CheY-like chemotaxis protein/two-component sensor histidine kinase
LGIINDLLDLSKIEAGKLELINESYETTSLISDTANLYTSRIGSKPIEFKLHVDEEIPLKLIGDELRVKQILNNLLSNSFKYTDSGEVMLSFSSEICDDKADNGNTVMLTITVRDTGQGMTEEQLQNLFDAYSRFNMKVNRFIEGTGLGMNIVQHLVKNMNGDISVNSVIGKGTEVVVHLVQGYADSAKLGRELADNLMNFRLTSISKMKGAQITREYMPYGKVLVVDDMETNLYVARGFLLPYGLVIDTALSGKVAIEKITNGNKYDIIYMDHMMPVMDGIEATKLIREKGYIGPIIALTANAVVGQAEIFMANGFDGFISKPIDIRELNASLNKFIRDRQVPEVIEAARAASPNGVSLNVMPQISSDLAKIFANDAERAIAILQGYGSINSNWVDDLRISTINVHALKSALANTGETRLSDFARDLEQAGRKGSIAFILEKTPLFLGELRTLVDKIKSGIKEFDVGDVSDEDNAYFRKMLLAVKEACTVYDIDATKAMFTELKQKQWPGKYGKFIDTIGEHLLHSDFDDVVAACSTYLSDRNEE